MVKKEYIRDGRAPIPRRETTSRVMSANRAKNTGPEIILRKELRKEGISGARYHLVKIIGRPDIAFPKKRVAIFIHGCFWHRCPRCKMRLPKTHKKFWGEKFTRNKERDERKLHALKKLGWRPVIIWEHEIQGDVAKIAQKIIRYLRRPLVKR